MDKDKIIEQYNATDVIVSDDLVGVASLGPRWRNWRCLDLQGR